jgi:hypothetical protein
MTTEIHDLAHRWQGRPSDGTLNPGWDCPHCLLSSPVAFDALCPDLVAAALRKVEAERDEARAEVAALKREVDHLEDEILEINSWDR